MMRNNVLLLISLTLIIGCLNDESQAESNSSTSKGSSSTIQISSLSEMSSSTNSTPKFNIDHVCYKTENSEKFLYNDLDTTQVQSYEKIKGNEYFVNSKKMLLGESRGRAYDSTGQMIGYSWLPSGDTLWVEVEMRDNGSLNQIYESTDANFSLSTLIDHLPEELILGTEYYLVYEDLCYNNWGFRISKFNEQCIKISYGNFKSACRGCPDAIYCKNTGLMRYDDGFEFSYIASKEFSRAQE